MLLPHPAVLKILIGQGGPHRALSAGVGGAGTCQQVEGVIYTPGVQTGTRDVGAAVTAAPYQRPGAWPQEASTPDLAMCAEARSGFGRTRTAAAPCISAG
ncbi:DUF5133 domain-containing protein [Streptomyces sp. NBC_00306]|uniref:DUF5133 domain-containing protein n=1 Tax=Streptomyces sp. NBC_00306 TaxID=2975708 RepID=UPI002E2897BE|nr:DUF5133 domain-containing protein [Streptomyces sp. NBC_00306]